MGDIKDLKNEYAGERIFIIGNGPSLNETPLDELSSEYTIAMNKIHKIYTETKWRPSFFFFGHHILNTKKKRYVRHHIDLNIPCFINSKHSQEFGQSDNIYYFNKIYLKNSSVDEINFHKLSLEQVKNLPISTLAKFWADNVSKRLFTYHSMYGVIQLCFYLGFDKMYLLGCDLFNEDSAPHMIFNNGLDPLLYDSKIKFAKDTITSLTPLQSFANAAMFKILESDHSHLFAKTFSKLELINDNSHFADDYDYQPKNFAVINNEMRKGHIAAKRMANYKNFEIYNSTYGGELEVYPRVDLMSVLDE